MPTNQSFIPSLLLILFVLPLLFLQGNVLDTIVIGIDHCSILSCDFQRHYLPQTQKFILGQEGFVSGWFYPPLLVILIYPFSHLPNPEVWWSIFLLFSSIALSYTTHKYSNKTFSFQTTLLLICISLPVIHCFKWGQVSILITIGLITALHTRGYFAGMILGFLGALKLYPLLFVLPFLLQKKHQEIISMGLSFIFFALCIPLLTMPIETVFAYYQNAMAASQNIQGMAAGLGGQAISPSATRWFEDGSYGTNVMNGGLIADIPFLSSLLVMGILLPSIYLLYKAPTSPFAPVLTLCFMSLLLSPGWEHYFCFLPYCWLVLYREGSSYSRIILVLLLLLQYTPISYLFGYGISFFTYAKWGGSTLILLIMLLLTWKNQYQYIDKKEENS
jgi:hypothetical protein